jgi:hypothetical protein
MFGSFLKLIVTIIFPSGFASQAVLNKEPTVWLDGARSANTCIPTYFPGGTCLCSHATYPQTKVCLRVSENECLRILKIYKKTVD